MNGKRSTTSNTHKALLNILMSSSKQKDIIHLKLKLIPALLETSSWPSTFDPPQVPTDRVAFKWKIDSQNFRPSHGRLNVRAGKVKMLA